jgi:Flp pilus assembly protein TadG
MVAFAVDMGYICHVRTELQRTADAAALAAAESLLDDDDLRGISNQADDRIQAQTAINQLGAVNSAGRVPIAVLSNDITFGYVRVVSQPDNMLASTFQNAVKVVVRRDDSANTPINLFFAPVIGKTQQTVRAEATAVMEAAIRGFAAPSAQPSKLLPYTMQINDWNALFTSGEDNFAYNPSTGAVTAGQDGIREVRLFPLSGSATSTNGSGKKNSNSSSGVTPGNFGTIDLGNPNNSTADLARQILNGPNAQDFSFFPGNKIVLGSNGTLLLQGDTGISAGVKDELESIKGKARIIPLYSTVTGNGNNAQFTITKFVGCRILNVQLTGSMSSKHVLIQPAFCVDYNAISGGTEGVTSGLVRRPLSLIK